MMVMVGYRLMKISFEVINPVLLYVTLTYFNLF